MLKLSFRKDEVEKFKIIEKYSSFFVERVVMMLLINVINFSFNGEKFEILFLVSSVNLMFSVGRYNNDKMMDSNREIL